MPRRFEQTRRRWITVYVDGACLGNGQGEPYAGIGVFWSDGDPDNCSLPLYGRATNQRAELEAAIKAIEIAISYNYKRLRIHTDSKYVIMGATEYYKKWRNRGWRNAKGQPVANQEEWKCLLELMEDDRILVQYSHVPGHSGNYGNEEANRLAEEGAIMARDAYFSDSD